MASSAASPASADAPWPGRDLGLPSSGPRSIARLGRRIAGIAIDWAVASVLSALFYAYDGFATLIIFVVLQIVFVLGVSGSIGHLLLGMRVVPVTGGRIGLWRPVVRAILIALVIPAVIWDRDQRGFHDKIAGTVLVRV